MSEVETVPEILCYLPNKGVGYGHGASPRALPKLWPAIERFMQEVTISSGPSRISVEITSDKEFEGKIDIQSYVEKATNLFGFPPEKGRFTSSDPQGNITAFSHSWNLNKEEFNKAVNFIIDGHPWPKQVHGPCSLNFSYEFIWRDPRTGNAFPGQVSGNNTESVETKSDFLFFLERNSFISTYMEFPYSINNERLYDLLSVVHPLLPFKPTLRNFRIRIPKKRGSGYYYRKVSKTENARLSEFTTR